MTISLETDQVVQSLRARCPQARRLTADSRRVAEDSLFLAFPGRVHDGRHYIVNALDSGAAGVVWEPEGFAWRPGWQTFNQPVPGLARAAPGLAAAWYDHPSRALHVIGITGTNGKTSVSHWLAQALTDAGRPTACVGTLGNGLPGALSHASHTTPDAVSLQGLLADYRDAGLAGIAMEVSSHGLDQGRVEGVEFDIAVLTNLSRDHLDYHGDMATYAEAKARLFGWPGLRWAVLNCDDDFGRALRGRLVGSDVRVLAYGLGHRQVSEHRHIDLLGEELRLSASGLSMTVHTPWGTGVLESPLLGEFNAYNLLAALGALLASGLSLDESLGRLGQAKAVAGRMQAVARPAECQSDCPAVVVDYAHTPDALEQVLRALRPLTPGRLICVFGAGGGRDKGKRPLMAAAVASLADQAVVTSDNPREEDPAAIIADLLAAMPPGQTALTDRGQAIRHAIAGAGPEDLVLIAGKGHEDYQEIHGVRHPFSDLVQAQAALNERARSHAPH